MLDMEYNRKVGTFGITGIVSTFELQSWHCPSTSLSGKI
jgi:hypothetical protein